MTQVYHVQQGDTLWQFTKSILEKNNIEATNAKIMEYMTKMQNAYHCDSIDSVARKLFVTGNTFEISDSVFEFLKKEEPKRRRMYPMISEKDTFSNESTNVDTARKYAMYDVDLSKIDTAKTVSKPKKTETLQNPKWDDIKAQQQKINDLPTDKERIIEYHKQIDKSKENYVVIDKKEFSATVYSWDGKIIKSYEIGVAKNKSDDLLKRSKKHPEDNVEATTAGIYTANYRATGKDAYRRLYNDRVLTLSNDGLREKGVKVKDKYGNVTVSYAGETGVALHQVPNGNKERIRKLKEEGVSEKNNRFSWGCVNFLPEDFDDCMANIKGVGTKVYILPEDENNYMTVKNGRLHFCQKEYTGKVATTSTKNDEVKDIIIMPADYDNMRQEGKDMAMTLTTKKRELINELGLDNDTYNELAQLVLGIAGQETGYGDPLAGLSIKKMNAGYWAKENLPASVVNFAKRLKGNESYNSRGLTQCKLQSYTDEATKALLKKYGITEDNLNNPEKAAIATMIVLSCIYKNELPSLKDKIEECGLSKTDALLYCYQGRKWKIKNGTARSTYEYIQNVKSFKKDFVISQVEEKNKVTNLFEEIA